MDERLYDEGKVGILRGRVFMTLSQVSNKFSGAHRAAEMSRIG